MIYRDIQLRHCAVLGFIEILCSVQLNSFTILSQNTNSQDSWPGLFTQVIWIMLLRIGHMQSS